MLKPIPMNDLSRVFAAHEHELSEALLVTARSGHWLNGSRTHSFAQQFTQLCGTRFCLPIANGTDALEIALRALLVGQKKSSGEIVTVANAGGYTTTACRQLGLTPVYVDIEPASQLVDSHSVVAALSEETRAIVATHLYGGVVDVASLRTAVNRAGFSHIPILEDCAQAHGGRLGNLRVGGLGDIATFSFYPTKNLGAIGDAGAIVTSDASLFEICRSLHQYGWTRKYVSTIAGGRNSRMDEVQAAVLGVLLPELERWNQRRRNLLASYREAAGVRAQFVHSKGDSVGHLAVALCGERDAMKKFFNARQIETDIHYPILDSDQLAWNDAPHRIGPAGLEVSRRSVSRLLTVPCFPFLKNEEEERICDALRAWEAHKDAGN
jgi:dTDP-3-amino-2,3,6-trideoxy-4-keto-D-glucose/dTDP-3-amino-3,4,6-trideoxy-alpha-D-glucose/dTDP-2,6-dideoxy-D-kanosamine transaminase